MLGWCGACERAALASFALLDGLHARPQHRGPHLGKAPLRRSRSVVMLTIATHKARAASPVFGDNNDLSERSSRHQEAQSGGGAVLGGAMGADCPRSSWKPQVH
mmetsp:Transcript_2287/g.7327  ORF Transcript_2287/g.7327 Transcript_2287/m.7327 type:complete len:104 (+) Transcript_2287:110-421(+)|eukprot:scaffold217361_cov37-Tisochrysis_lutea.AAC.1